MLKFFHSPNNKVSVTPVQPPKCKHKDHKKEAKRRKIAESASEIPKVETPVQDIHVKRQLRFSI